MVGCSAFGCNNRSEQGFLMKVFPRDPDRRKQWTTKVRRTDWKPTNKSYLCEEHFEPDMWEKTREDGSKKLKWNAVPTIFSFKKTIRKRKATIEKKHMILKPEPSTTLNQRTSSPEFISFLKRSESPETLLEQDNLVKCESDNKKVIVHTYKHENGLQQSNEEINCGIYQNDDYTENLQSQSVLKKSLTEIKSEPCEDHHNFENCFIKQEPEQ